MSRDNFLRSVFLAAAVLTAVFVANAPSRAVGQDAPKSTYPGTVGDWFGFELHDFKFQGRPAKIVLPKKPADGAPWIWRARFFGHEPQFDVAMLERGYAVVYVESNPLMGSPKSVALWQAFYEYLTKELKFGPKANLEGMSRGGLYTTNWAFAYPDEVATIYIDNPVLDFKSWPGAFGKSKGRSDGDWKDVLAAYELTEEEALAYKLNPIDNLEGMKKLAERKVGIFFVCGDSDTVVPFEENAKIFIERYKSVGGPVELILKPGNDHHPHSIKDPTPLVDFVLKFNAKAE